MNPTNVRRNDSSCNSSCTSSFRSTSGRPQGKNKTIIGLLTDYSHLFNKRGAWNKRGGGAKVAKSLNVEVGINVEGGIFFGKN